MYRKLALLVAVMAPAASAQQVKGVSQSIDTFTGDTIWTTSYGRFDNPNGCKRLSMALFFRLVRGAGGSREVLTYEYLDIDGPLHKAKPLAVVTAALNIDGQFLQAEAVPLSGRLQLHRDSNSESGDFNLPAGTLKRIGEARSAKLKLAGIDGACDGELEANIKTRTHDLVATLQP